MLPSPEFLQAIENSVGLPIEQIQQMPLDALRKRAEQLTGHPTIVTGADTLTHAQVESLLSQALEP
jgi:hypothetical protein